MKFKVSSAGMSHANVNYLFFLMMVMIW